jgi:hypothetical protein
MQRKTRPSYDQLRAWFNYDAETGVLTWRVNRGAAKVAGKRAGSIHKSGCRVVMLSGCLEKEARVIWCYVYGHWPILQIDHINGDECDNRVSNLRDISNAMNCQNKRRAPSTNKHGMLGASPVGHKWRAQIKVEGKKIYLGMYETAQQANNAYMVAKRILHPGCMF